MKKFNVLIWTSKANNFKWENLSLKNLGFKFSIYDGRKNPPNKILKNIDLVILEEKFKKSFNYPLPKLILSEKEKYLDLDRIKDAINYFNEYYDSILYSLPSAALIINNKGIILKANKKYFKLFSDEKIIGKNINYFFLDLKKNIFQTKEKMFEVEANYYDHKNFKDILYKLEFQKIKDGFFVILKDITLNKKKETLNFLIQKATAISNLAGGVAHDLNNILMIISSYSSLLEKKVEGNEVKSFLYEINKGVERAKELSDKLISFSGKQILNPQVIEINNVLNYFLERYKEKNISEIKFEFIKSKTLPFIKIDIEKFEKIFENILKNSEEAMEQKGTILIETSFKEVKSSFKEFPILDKGKWVQITITDAGCGMDKETAKRVFEPFFTTKPKGKGKGLGLAEAYGFIKQSGGFIFCDSELNIGTTIFIFLRAYEGEEKPEIFQLTKKEDEKPPFFKGKKVLIVEDEGGLLSSLSMILASVGFEVFKSSSGEEAIEISKRVQERIDLIISDVILPGIDGKEAIEKITKKRENTPVIFMSGYSHNIISKHNILTNKVNFISKPFSVDDLIKKIQEVLKTNI